MIKSLKICFMILCMSSLVMMTGARKSKSFVPAPAAAVTASGSTVPMLDDMNAVPEGWKSETDSGATVTLSADKGQNGKALCMTYNLNSAAWLGARKQIMLDLTKYKGIKFFVKGTGEANTIQFKIEMPDFTNFGIELNIKSNEPKWKEVKIPFTDIGYLWGASKTLSLNNPIIHFAIIKKDEDAGGAGKLFIDKIELY